MVTIRKGAPEEQGVWFLSQEPVFDKKHKAIVTCPICNQSLSLQRHTIRESGIVFPSVVCVRTECKFNKYIELEGWTHGEMK